MIAVLFGIIVWQQRREIQRLRHSNAYLRETLRGTQIRLLKATA